MQDNAQLRTQLRQARRALTDDEQNQHQQRAAKHLLSLPLWQNTSLHVGVSLSFDGELSLAASITLLRRQKHHLYLPCLHTDGYLIFAHWNVDTPLIKNQYGIEEPNTTQYVLVDQLDVLLLPLVGVDQQGNRLGMGGGYYDKTLARVQCRPYLIGMAHHLQQVEQLAAQPWDIPLDALITEQGCQIWHPFSVSFS